MNYVDAIDTAISNLKELKKACRQRIIKSFTLDNMAVNMDKQFKKYLSNPNKEKIKNGKKLSKNIKNQ